MMVVYVDIVFLTNLVLDFAMLLVTAKVRGLAPVYWRTALSSAIGAGYVLFMFVPELSVLYTFVVKCLFSAAMIMTAFGFRSVTSFAGNLAAFYAVNAAAAGAIFGAHYLLASSHEVWNGILFTQTGSYRHVIGLSLWFIVLAGAAGALLFRKVQKGALRKARREQYTAEVTVRIGRAQVRCIGLIDTGNHLYDPLTRTPVMVMEADVWKGTLPDRWLQVMSSREPEQIAELLDETENGAAKEEAAGREEGAGSRTAELSLHKRIRLVPYRGIGGSGRLMAALKPDEVTIVANGRTIRTDRVLIGLEGGALNADGAYRALVHPMLVS